VEGLLGLDDFYPKALHRPRPANTAADGSHSLAPGMVSGIMQVNLQIPARADLASGPVPIVITLTDPLTGASFGTQAQATVSVR